MIVSWGAYMFIAGGWLLVLETCDPSGDILFVGA